MCECNLYIKGLRCEGEINFAYRNEPATPHINPILYMSVCFYILDEQLNIFHDKIIAMKNCIMILKINKLSYNKIIDIFNVIIYFNFLP